MKTTTSFIATGKDGSDTCNSHMKTRKAGEVPHLEMSASDFIDYINLKTMDESKRCRILLAEVLYRLEKLEESK